MYVVDMMVWVGFNNMFRSKQTNCQNEPIYSEHKTVVFVIAYPEYTCHTKTKECQIKYPHLIIDCGLWYKR